MKVKYGYDIYDGWKVTRDEKPEEWIQELLDAGKMKWKKDGLGRIWLEPQVGM